MDHLQVFNHELFGKLTVEVIEGDEMFDLHNVAWSLGYTRQSKGTDYLRYDRVNAIIEKLDITTVDRGGQLYINESGLYDFVFEAGTSRARDFRKWVTSDVLPSIRKHGTYMTSETIEKVLTDPDTIIRIATDLKEERAMRVAAEMKIREEKKYTNFGKVISLSDGAINVGMFAKIMYDDHGVNIGRNKLMAWLRDNDFLIRQEGREKNFPKQHYVERGWFRLATTIIKRTHGDVQGGTTLITGKGQVELAKILLEEFAALEV